MTGYSSEGPGFVAGSDTSRAAADAIKDTAPAIARDCLEAIRAAGSYGATSDEVADALLIAIHYSVRPRIAELRKERNIVDSGRRRRLKSGRFGAVWVAAEHTPVADKKRSDG